MKTIYLWVFDKGWTPFPYNELSELANEFATRNIKLGKWCTLGDECKLDNWCELGNGCKLGDGCTLGKGCKLGDWCTLGDEKVVPKALFINASKHTVSYWGDNTIQIGCKRFSIVEWQQHFREIGKAKDYTPDQIEEYKRYIDLIATMHKTWSIDKPMSSKE